MTDAKARVKAQYGSVGDAYVRSSGHATGGDLARMLALAEPMGKERLLDIATGGGHVARTFAPYVADVVAIDLTPEILHHAAEAFIAWGALNVSTAIADAEDLPFDEASFDLVTCRIAPHHFPQPGQFVAEVARVLRPGGQFLLVDSTVPEGEPGDWFNRIELLRDPSHVRSLCIAEWHRLLADAGLILKYTEDFRKTHDFEDWVARSRTSAEHRQALADTFATGDPRWQEAFAVTWQEGAVASFTDTKTLFQASKP